MTSHARTLLTLLAMTPTGCGGFGELDRRHEVDRLSPIGGAAASATRAAPLTSARGQPIDVRLDKPSRPLLVVFSRLSCQACRQEASSVSAFATQYRGRVDVLGVQLDASADEARRYADTRGGFPSAWDPTGQTARTLGVIKPPSLVLITTDGRVVSRHAWLSPTLREAVDTLLDRDR